MFYRVVAATVLFLFAAESLADRVAAPGSLTARRCDKYVYLDEGALRLEGKPWAFKSVNYRVDVVVKEAGGGPPPLGNPRLRIDGKDYDFFIAANGSYSPDNNSWCRDPKDWNPQVVCCSDAVSCAVDLARDVEQLKKLGVNSVRLLMDYLRFDGDAPRFLVGRMGVVPQLQNFLVDITQPAIRDAVYTMLRRAVQFLGARGVRSLLLLNAMAYYKDNRAQGAAFEDFLAGLAANLKDEPFLVGFDFYNEPNWFSGAPKGAKFDIDKKGARDIVQSWVRVVRERAQNNRALLTIGNAWPLASLDTWDPQFLPLDFNSYHLYPPDPVNIKSSRPWLARESYYASLGGGGVKCPYLGSYDGASCFLKDGPPGAKGKIDQHLLFYEGRPETCPAAQKRPHQRCAVAEVEPGRDKPFVLEQSIFYVKPKSGCPKGTSFDGANCTVGEAPVGAQAFLWPDRGKRGFYYKYLAGGTRCRAPAKDDGANCFFAEVPAGYEPFKNERPMFYVEPVSCGNGRIPYILGETALSVNEVDPKTGAITKPTQGTPRDQADYLRGSAEVVFASGFQGYQWWQYADVHWGNPKEDHFGLWGDFRQVNPGQPVPQPDAMAMRMAGEVLRDSVDFTKTRPTLVKPDGFHDPVLPDDAKGGKLRYEGAVIDQHLKPVPFAFIQGGFMKGGGNISWIADGRGRFSFTTKRLLGQVRGTAHGYLTSRRYNPVPIAPLLISLHRVDAKELPQYRPPSENKESCRGVTW
jgi:hypothetical protein